MPDVGLQPPYLAPQAYPDYLDVQRREMVANMLLNAMGQSNQPNPQWNAMRAVPRRGVASNIAPLVAALLAKRGVSQAQEAEQKYFSNLYSPQPAQGARQDSGEEASPTSGSAPIAAPGPPAGAPTSALAPSQNPMIPPGMDQGTAQMAMSLMGPQAYAEKFIAPRYQPAQIEAQLRAAGIDPNSQLGRQIAQQSLAKANYIAPTAVRPGGALVPAGASTPSFVAPQGGIGTAYDQQGNPVNYVVPGAAPAIAAVRGVETAAQTANTPHYEPDPFHPGQFHAAYPPTPPALAGTQPPSAAAAGVTTPPKQPGAAAATTTPPAQERKPTTAADLEQQKEGAKSGEAYSNQLIKNATSATEVMRSLSELQNLAKTAPPSVLNQAKLDTGSWLIAMGASPQWVAKVTGADVGALVAASKQTGTLALDSIHDMTNRGTNFDLATFMKYNPNLNMGSPEGFNRVVQFINQKMSQEVAKQADFDQWSRNVPPNKWASGHTAHWLGQQQKLIAGGGATSTPQGAPPAGAVSKQIGGKTYYQVGGKWYDNPQGK